MKISDILQQQSIPGRQQTSGPAGGTDFAAVLQSHLRGADSTTPTGDINQTATATGPVPSRLRLESLELSENAIATLDAFSRALGNPALRADELEPYVSVLETKVAAMLDLKSELPEQEPLAKILEEVATVSFLETAKYRRGDYH